MNQSTLKSRRIDVANSFDQIQDYYEDQGGTDGFPVVPATADLVQRMLGAFVEDPARARGVIQPHNAPVTRAHVAVHASRAELRP